MTEYWEPRTEADLETARTQGLFTESHIFDVKKQPPPPQKNGEIAIDLANFAVDGGKILYGVGQPKSNGSSVLSPFNTDGLAERLDQIARGGAIDPPLQIRCLTIPSEANPELGYLLVVIPPSPDAPHMVDGRYRYRSDRTNAVPSDAEVRRLLAERETRQSDIEALLQQEVERDPTDSSLRTQGHLFIVAQPLLFRRDLLARAIGTQDWQLWLQTDFRNKVMSVPTPSNFEPDLFQSAQTISSRLDGWAVSTYQMGPDRRIRPNGTLPATENQLLDLEVRDNGGLRLFCGRASFEWSALGQVIFDLLIAILTRRMVRAATAVSEKADFQGEWHFGLAIRGIEGASISRGPFGGLNPRRLDSYDETATASFDELETSPDDIARRLLARFFRAFGYLDQIPGL